MGSDAETAFNGDMRQILRGQGLGAIHLVQCDQPGPADLVVWSPAGVILGWLELKVDKEELRPSQVEFLREEDRRAGNAFVVRQTLATGLISVERPKSVDGWSTDRKKLDVIHVTQRIVGVNWAAYLAQWRRPLGLSKR